MVDHEASTSSWHLLYLAGAIAAFIVLIEPLPTPAVNQHAVKLVHVWIFSLNPQSWSPSYYVGYVLVNAHILLTVLLVAALYFGFTKRPWLSALLFAFSAFDPRAALIAFPVLLWFNRQKILQFAASSAAFILATNLPFFFYHDIGLTFLRAETSGKIISQMYPYDWIPLYAIVTLTVLEIVGSNQNSKNHSLFNLKEKLRIKKD